MSSAIAKLADSIGWLCNALHGHVPADEELRIAQARRLAHEARESEAPQEPSSRPRVVTLCGSTRFSEAFQAASLSETLAGRIVLSIGCDLRSDDCLGLNDETRAKLVDLHKRKIDISDEILVLNVGGYVGESTRAEINHAIALGKEVRWLEPPAKPEPVGSNPDPTSPAKCTTCGGEGWYSDKSDDSRSFTCDQCHGTGKQHADAHSVPERTERATQESYRKFPEVDTMSRASSEALIYLRIVGPYHIFLDRVRALPCVQVERSDDIDLSPDTWCIAGKAMIAKLTRERDAYMSRAEKAESACREALGALLRNEGTEDARGILGKALRRVGG